MIARGALRVSPEVKLLPLIIFCSKQNNNNYCIKQKLVTRKANFECHIFQDSHMIMIKQDKNHVSFLNFIYQSTELLFAVL